MNLNQPHPSERHLVPEAGIGPGMLFCFIELPGRPMWNQPPGLISPTQPGAAQWGLLGFGPVSSSTEAS